MARTSAKLSASLLLLSSFVWAQGLTTTATKDDWEEINFETNSSTLSDGYPSLLRLAELLNKNPGYKVKLVGHTDSIGSHPFNDKLGLKRAQAVQQFLEKYGARPGQITAESKGKNSPKVDNGNKEGRFINRRTEMTVLDDKGKVVGAGGVGDAIKTLEQLAKKQEECCSMILKRLDKLDEILAALRDLKNQNNKLQSDMDELKAAAAKGHAGGGAGTAGMAGNQGAAGTGGGGMGVGQAQADDIANKAAKKAVEEMARHGHGPGGPQFTLLGLNAGPDQNGNATFTGKGRVFLPFSSSSAVQAQGEYMYWRDRKEGQFDIGVVNRYKQLQMGVFSSFKTVGLRDMQSNGTLGQFAFAADYLFKGGRIGAFATKSFLDNAVINRRNISTFVTEETYLRVNDQIGGQGSIQLGRRAWMEGNLGYIHSRAGNDKPGGTLRFIFPINKMFALSAEGGVNETLIGKDTTGSARFGFLFGNFMQPKDMLGAPGPVPMEVPRVRFEILTRRLRTGNSPPVADAGPDQIGQRAGQIQLDGSASFDPDGDPIKFLWTQIAGPTVAITGADQAKASFTAAVEGQQYSFRLTVTDDHGGQGIARVTITTREASKVRVIRFTANPPVIKPGDVSLLNYLVENAETVTISGVTEALKIDTGTVSVRPQMTTTYTITARNRVSEDQAVVTVLVDRPGPRIIRFQAEPQSILVGGKSRLVWETQDADSVEIPNVGTFAPNGSVEVMPAQTLAYTLIARNKFGEATAATVINVQSGPRPLIVQFNAAPMQIVEGDSSTLTWNVQSNDATEVTITPVLGKVQPSGSGKVTPPVTTTYTLTATNQFGTSTAQATVEVLPRVKIISFTATPTTINTPGQPVTFSWQTENCQSVFIDGGIGTRPCNGSLTNAGPLGTQTYTLTAIGRGSNAMATATVTLVKLPGPDPKPPIALVAQSEIVTSFRDLILNAAGSQDPQGLPLTFSWRSLDNKADVLNPSSATPTVKLRDINFGDFQFEVTVTNSAGLSSKAVVRVILVLARPLF